MAAHKGNKYALGNKGGRPKFEIDLKAVDKLSKMQCTQLEICAFLGCSIDVLQNSEEFNHIYKQGMSEGKASLRRMQWAAAKEGNNTMLIWLGKQYLGQSDKRDIKKEVTVTDAREISDAALLEIAAAGNASSSSSRDVKQAGRKKITH